MTHFDTIFQKVVEFIKNVTKHVKPAMLAVVLFLTLTFAFAMKSNLLGSTAQTAMLPTATEQQDTVAQQEEEYVVGMELEKMEPLPTQEIDTETLWLARGIYSETKEPQEQELVAWTIRNRVETGYRDNDSYQEAVLDPYQFSAFIVGTRTREHYANLAADSNEPGFQNAVAIAKQVKEAEAVERPFSETTRHFFSEQSMAGGKHPNWAAGKTPVKPARPLKLDAKRFRFYEDIG
jgi:hypothetical protein